MLLISNRCKGCVYYKEDDASCSKYKITFEHYTSKGPGCSEYKWVGPFRTIREEKKDAEM